jgi:hypothetical protein
MIRAVAFLDRRAAAQGISTIGLSREDDATIIRPQKIRACIVHLIGILGIRRSG